MEDKRTPEEKARWGDLVNATMEFVVELDEAAVKRWIDQRWPNGWGSHEIINRMLEANRRGEGGPHG
jgi:hypothetical protein